MTRMPDIVCVSTNHWTGLPTSKQHLMSILASRVRVLYVDPPIDVFSVLGRRRRWSKLGRLRRVSGGPWVLSPVVLDNRSRRRGAFHARMRGTVAGAARRVGIERPVLWTFAPAHEAYVGALDERLVVYQAADDPRAFSSDPDRTAVQERRLIERADVVFASSVRLAQERAWSGKARRLANAADARHFARVLGWRADGCAEDVLRAVRASRRPPDLPSRGGVVLYGGAAYEWFDDDLLAETAARRPSLTFVLVGPSCARVSSRRFPPNVRLLGRRGYDAFPRYVASADCAVIPWRRGVFSEYADPIVLYELLLCGVPVVATSFPAAVERGRLVRTADAPADFAEALDDAIGADDPEVVLDRVRFGLSNTWEDRVEEATSAIISALA
jgi:glycosyltransferase involved in cell wall biosynthesis